MKIVGSRVVAARLYGSIDILQLQSFTHGRPIDWNFSIAYRRTHIRTGSAGSIDCKHLMQVRTLAGYFIIIIYLCITV